MSFEEINPFEEPVVDNSFIDTSLHQAKQNVKQLVQDYNPFNVDQQPSSSYQTRANQESAPAVLETRQESLPSLLSLPASSKQTFQTKQAEEPQKPESKYSEQSTYNGRRNNWPPLPSQCGLQPCFYQNIEVDIPLEHQKVVYSLYYVWVFHSIMMLVNIIGATIASEFKKATLGIFYSLVLIPCSYICWFRPAYKAFRSNSSVNFIIFFFVFFFQFITSVIQALGLRSSGTIGLITAIAKFKSSDTSGAFLLAFLELAIACGFACVAVADFLLLSQIHHIYHDSGASFAQAQKEFSSEIIKNQHVRKTAANIAAAAIQSQTSSSLNRK